MTINTKRGAQKLYTLATQSVGIILFICGKKYIKNSGWKMYMYNESFSPSLEIIDERFC